MNPQEVLAAMSAQAKPLPPPPPKRVLVWPAGGGQPVAVWRGQLLTEWLAAGATLEPPEAEAPAPDPAPEPEEGLSPEKRAGVAELRDQWLAANPGKRPPAAAGIPWFTKALKPKG